MNHATGISRLLTPSPLATLVLLVAAAQLGCTRSHVGWNPATASPIPRFEGPAAVVGDKLYVFGGFHDSGLNATTRVDVYDPRADRWTRLADMPKPLTHLTPAVDDHTVWFAGGFDGKHPGPVADEVFAYDVRADTWSRGPSLPEPRGSGALVRLGRRLHFFGGFAADRDTTPGDHWVLDLDSPATWHTLAPLPDPRGHLGGIAWAGRIYAIGGQHGHDRKATDVASMHAYDADTDRWSALAPLPTPRSHFEAGTFVWGDRIVIAGGRNNVGGEESIARLSAYDPGTDAWNELAEMPAALLGPVLQPIGPRLILTTGGLGSWDNPRPETFVANAEELLARAASTQ